MQKSEKRDMLYIKRNTRTVIIIFATKDIAYQRINSMRLVPGNLLTFVLGTNSMIRHIARTESSAVNFRL